GQTRCYREFSRVGADFAGPGASLARENGCEQKRQTSMTEFKNRPTTVADYFAIIRRRKWAVIVPPIVAGVAAFFVSSSQSPLYRATAQMLVNRTSVVSAVTQITDPAVLDAQRFLSTEATIGRSPELARRVAAQIPGMTPGRVLSETSITPSSDRDLLTVAADDRQYGTAVRLANVYANRVTADTQAKSC